MAILSEVDFTLLSADGRLDSEFYSPEYLRQEHQISELSSTALEDIAWVSDGNHLSISDDFLEEGVRYLRGQDLNEFFISDANPIYISYENYDLLKRSHIYPNDVLLSIVGTVGNISVVTPEYNTLTGSCKIAILRPIEVNSLFLAAYLANKESPPRAAGYFKGV